MYSLFLISSHRIASHISPVSHHLQTALPPNAPMHLPDAPHPADLSYLPRNIRTHSKQRTTHSTAPMHKITQEKGER